MTLEDQIKATAAQGEDLKARVATMTAALNAMDAVVSEMSERVEKLERKGISRGAFRLLFSFGERELETAKTKASEEILAAGLPDPADQTATVAYYDARAYLTMRADFADADFVDPADPAVALALAYYVGWGIITAERETEILATLAALE